MNNNEFICSDCGFIQVESERYCEQCGSVRIILTRVAKAMFGKRWKNRLLKHMERPEEKQKGEKKLQ